MRQLASYPRQNGVAAALRELGRLERTLFTLDWLEDSGLRRQTSRELNKGESRNSLARAVFIHRLGEIRDRTYENQQHRASGLNLLVTAIILWNTRYLNRAIAALREVEDVPDHLLAHLSPLGWEHVNLTGDYVWSADQNTVNADGYRPLRRNPKHYLTYCGKRQIVSQTRKSEFASSEPLVQVMRGVMLKAKDASHNTPR
jgi:hypothetical protein